MDTGLFIAARYLFARKSHNVINVISAISASGMAIGTAALILILSVCNGFDAIIRQNLSDIDPDITVTRADGASFVPDSLLVSTVEEACGGRTVQKILEQNVIASYSGKQALASIKGVDASFESVTPLSGHLVSGDFKLHSGGMPQACVGAGLARQMGINPRFLEKLVLLYPGRGEAMPLLGAISSLGSVKVGVTGVFSINTSVDSRLILIPIETARELLGKSEGEVTQLAINMEGENPGPSIRKLESLLGKDGFRVLDRYRLNPSVYRMMKYEKFSVYIVLLFVVIVVAFNIFGSMSMLIIEKRQDMETLRAMGASDRLSGRIFMLEGWMISLLGLAVGLLSGTGLALIQQHFGIIKMPGAYSLNAYPALLLGSDVLWTGLGVALIGLIISYLAARSSRT